MYELNANKERIKESVIISNKNLILSQEGEINTNQLINKFED